MSTPATISLIGRTWCQAESLEQFRHQESNKKSRRIGLRFYLYSPEELPVMIQDRVDQKTDAEWLDQAIKNGSIYLEQPDFEITRAAWQANIKK